ncbi:hypothetical protein ACWD6L_25360 [Micromonospora profundi]
MGIFRPWRLTVAAMADELRSIDNTVPPLGMRGSLAGEGNRVSTMIRRT